MQQTTTKGVIELGKIYSFLLLLLLMIIVGPLSAQIVTNEIDVVDDSPTRLQNGHEDKLIIGEHVQVTDRLGIGTATPDKPLEVVGEARVTGKIQVGELEIGNSPYWRNLNGLLIGSIKGETWTDIIGYGGIKHTQGFRILIRYSNNSNHNHNYISEVMGICRHPSFSGSAIQQVNQVSTYLGVNGEIASASYLIDANGSGCRVRAHIDIRGNHYQPAFYVLKLETL